jgi:hypothetical protein
MDALDVETSIAEGEQALEALIKFAREHASKLEAHEAEQGTFKRLLPMGLAAMKLSCAQRGTGDLGAAITREDGVRLPRETQLRGRDYGSLFGTCKVARTCDRTAGEPGILPLDAQVNLPERCDSYFLQAWMTLFEVEHPFQERTRWFEPLVDLEVAESVLREVAQEAPEDYEGFYAQRPVPQEDTEGALLVVRVDGKGGPMIKAEAVKLKAKLGTGEKRQRQKEALVGVSDTVDAKPRPPKRWQNSWWIRKRRVRASGGQAPRTRRPAGAARGQPGADEAGGHGTDQGRRRAPGSPASQTLGPPAGWRPRPVVPGAQALQALEACDVCAGQHARRRRPLGGGQRLVRGSLPGGQTLGAGEADRHSERTGGLRQRRTAAAPHEAETAAVGAGDARESHHVLR